MSWSSLALAACLALAGASAGACAGDPSAASEMPAQTVLPQAGPDTVVAEVAGRKVTLKELDEKWEEFDAAERARITQLLYQNRRNMLDQLVGDILIEDAAKAANQSVETFVAQDAARRQSAVTEAEIARFYDENKDRAQGRTLNDLRQQIKDFLEAQRGQQARAQLVEELTSKTSGGVKVLLEPPRYTVSVAEHDPIRGDARAPVTLVEFSDYQ
jgi:hypothetical protein